MAEVMKACDQQNPQSETQILIADKEIESVIPTINRRRRDLFLDVL